MSHTWAGSIHIADVLEEGVQAVARGTLPRELYATQLLLQDLTPVGPGVFPSPPWTVTLIYRGPT